MCELHITINQIFMLYVRKNLIYWFSSYKELYNFEGGKSRNSIM